jgi:hypothetical protein
VKRNRRLILHRQPVVNNLTTGPWLKRAPRTESQQPIPVRMFSYSTPATGAAPAAGSIVHSDNVINKLVISHTDLDGNDVTAGLSQLESGDFIAVGGKTYNVIAPVVEDVSGLFSYVTIDPEEQLQDGVYPVSGWKGAA